MRKQDKVIALFCSDLHLSLTPPPFRSNEPDWMAAQQRPIDELKALQKKYDCPIFCAGDIFDRWNSPAELINWAMEHLPYMHCIPGQHDLPEHDLGQIERSAYWTLVKASVIDHLPAGGAKHFADTQLTIFSFPYGTEITPRTNPKHASKFRIALIHQYNWVPGHVYDMTYSDKPALKTQHVSSDRKEFEGYDIVVSGDNHSPFSISVQLGKIQFINCGTFMRRKSNEWYYNPMIWMLHSDGRMTPYALDTSKNKHLDLTEAAELEKDRPDIDLSGLIDSLGKLGRCTLDFAEAMKHHLTQHPANKKVERRIFKAMES